MILYSSSVDGYLNVSDAKNGALIDSIEMNS
jgi:archaellum component FlaF (FlaF/FlaG flagellin family)